MNPELPDREEELERLLHEVKEMDIKVVQDKLEEAGKNSTDLKIFTAMTASKALELLEENESLPEESQDTDE